LHTDARTLENGALLEGDLCIVGAGASGITIARELANSNLKVLLLEGGGFDFDPQMQELYRGDIIGKPYYPLQAAALHFFGGTTNHWAGWCSTYEPIDFEKRDWVPHSGWPIRREDLDPFYARAQNVLELGPYKYDAADWKNDDPDRVPLLNDSHVVWTKMWQFSPPTRFGQKYRSEIVNSANVHLYTHANVVEVEANDGLTAVQSVRTRGFDGRQHVGLGIGAEDQADLLVPGGIDVVQLASASVNQFFQDAPLLLHARDLQRGAFKRVQHPEQVLPLTKNNLRGARDGAFFPLLMLHKIRTSHGRALQPIRNRPKEPG